MNEKRGQISIFCWTSRYVAQKKEDSCKHSNLHHRLEFPFSYKNNEKVKNAKNNQKNEVQIKKVKIS